MALLIGWRWPFVYELFASPPPDLYKCSSRVPQSQKPINNWPVVPQFSSFSHSTPVWGKNFKNKCLAVFQPTKYISIYIYIYIYKYKMKDVMWRDSAAPAFWDVLGARRRVICFGKWRLLSYPCRSFGWSRLILLGFCLALRLASWNLADLQTVNPSGVPPTLFC